MWRRDIQIARRMWGILDFNLPLIDDTHIFVPIIVGRVAPKDRTLLALPLIVVHDTHSDGFVSLQSDALHWEIIELLCEFGGIIIIIWTLYRYLIARWGNLHVDRAALDSVSVLRVHWV